MREADAKLARMKEIHELEKQLTAKIDEEADLARKRTARFGELKDQIKAISDQYAVLDAEHAAFAAFIEASDKERLALNAEFTTLEREVREYLAGNAVLQRAKG